MLGLGAFVLALAHSAGAEIVIAMCLVGAGVGLVYAMLAKLIVDAVSPEVTGVALGMNTVMRTIGGVVGGQVGAAILSAVTIPGPSGLPAENAFTITFLVSGLAAFAAVACTWRIPRRAHGPVPVLGSSAGSRRRPWRTDGPVSAVEPQRAYHEDLEYYEERADGLLASARDGTPEARAAFARWDAPMTEAGARWVMARQHGMDDWQCSPSTWRRCEAGASPSRRPTGPSRRATPSGCGLLDRVPGPGGRAGHQRQRPARDGRGHRRRGLVALLLERGADPARGNAHGWTALHQAGDSGSPELARMLLDAGARAGVAARGDGGTPLVCALFWGHREAAEVLAGHGVVPLNLRVAAGLGRLDLVVALVPERPPTVSPRREPTAASTARTAGSRTGAPRTSRRRSSTRGSRGPRAATGSSAWTSWPPGARGSTPTSIAARPSPGRRSRAAPAPPSACWSWAPTPAAAPPSADPTTARTPPPCTSRRRTGTWT